MCRYGVAAAGNGHAPRLRQAHSLPINFAVIQFTNYSYVPPQRRLFARLLSCMCASVSTRHKPHATLIRILSDIHGNLRQSKYEDSAAVDVRVAAADDDADALLAQWQLMKMARR